MTGNKAFEWAFYPLCVAAFLDAVLRVSPASDVTLFRVGLIGFLVLLGPLLMRSSVFVPFATIIAIATVYMGLQILSYGYAFEFSVVSYAILIVTLLVFLLIVATFARVEGVHRLSQFLFIWYLVILACSYAQLAFDLRFPNAPFRNGVARIFFGQENDASIAIAAFLPLLVANLRKNALFAVLLIGGIAIIYLNGTRMVLLAIAFYLAVISIRWLLVSISSRFAIRQSVLLAAVAICGVALIYLLRDVPMRFPDHSASLSEMVIIPIEEIFHGEAPAELTSINIRVTMAIASLHALYTSFGFGIAPGASTFLVSEYYPSTTVTSIHSFPLQIVVELGWLILGIVGFLGYRLSSRVDKVGLGLAITYFLLVVASATSGTITNYFYFACLALTIFAFKSDIVSKESGRKSSNRRDAHPGT